MGNVFICYSHHWFSDFVVHQLIELGQHIGYLCLLAVTSLQVMSHVSFTFRFQTEQLFLFCTYISFILDLIQSDFIYLYQTSLCDSALYNHVHKLDITCCFGASHEYSLDLYAVYTVVIHAFIILL